MNFKRKNNTHRAAKKKLDVRTQYWLPNGLRKLKGLKNEN
jgi:hypothetical protein